MMISSRPRSPGSSSSAAEREHEFLNLPLAWKHRNSKLELKKLRHSSSSPTSTSSADSFSSPNTWNKKNNQPRYQPYKHSETLRSSRSMPGLSIGSTWDGRPCPVHHMQKLPNLHHPHQIPRRAGSMFELRASPVPSFYAPVSPSPRLYAVTPSIDMHSHYGSFHSLKSNKSAPPFMFPNQLIAPQPQLPLHPLPPLPLQLPPMPPAYLLPPGARPRPLVIPAEPLPVRDSAKKIPMLMQDDVKKKYSCCDGPMPFVWFVVILVSVGVILGIILWATIG